MSNLRRKESFAQTYTPSELDSGRFTPVTLNESTMPAPVFSFFQSFTIYKALSLT